MFANKIIRSDSVKIEEFSLGACRICLAETDCQNIFELDYEGEDIVDIFKFCTRIELLRKYKDPDYVCISCITELVQAYEFIRKCQASHKYLLSIEKTTHKKITDDDNNSAKTEEIYIEFAEVKTTENDKNSEENDEEKDENDPHIEEIEIKVNSHKCPICSRKYATPNGLRKHSRMHKNLEEITSKRGEENLEKQINDIHSKEVEIKQLNSHQCPICLRDFSTSAGLKNHSRIIHENTEETASKNDPERKTDDEKNCYKCPVCPKDFTTPAGFKNHLNAHEKAESKKMEKESEERKILDTEIKQLKNCRKCPKCDKVFPTTGGLKIHYRAHANKALTFTCKVCNRNFTSKKNRGQHMMTHSLERPHRCKECSRGFRQKHALEAHMLIHSGERKVVCEFCAETFKQLKDLKYHHSQGDCRSIAVEKNQPKSCDICLIPLKSYRALRQHHSIVHKKKEFTCSECGKGFMSIWTLKQHLQAHTNNRPHVCSVCDKRFLQKNGLQRHMYLHTGERPHQCEICQKSFVQQHHLVTHMRMHRGEKPYTCQICLKGFSSKSNLTVHVRTHTGETPYMCDMCGARFHDATTLKKHNVKHDLEKVEKPDKMEDGSVDLVLIC